MEGGSSSEMLAPGYNNTLCQTQLSVFGIICGVKTIKLINNKSCLLFKINNCKRLANFIFWQVTYEGIRNTFVIKELVRSKFPQDGRFSNWLEGYERK
jgi:hypothetical protein